MLVNLRFPQARADVVRKDTSSSAAREPSRSGSPKVSEDEFVPALHAAPKQVFDNRRPPPDGPEHMATAEKESAEAAATRKFTDDSANKLLLAWGLDKVLKNNKQTIY